MIEAARQPGVPPLLLAFPDQQPRLDAPPVLLILACSGRKSPAPSLLPAWERYTGGAYGVLRGALAAAGGCIPGLTLGILSARYGLIPGDQPIPAYEQRLTPAQVEVLTPTVVATVERSLAATPYRRIYLHLGVGYRLPLAPSAALATARQAGIVTISAGGIGQQLQQLKTWLRAGAP